jgi:hypothetical protein
VCVYIYIYIYIYRAKGLLTRISRKFNGQKVIFSIIGAGTTEWLDMNKRGVRKSESQPLPHTIYKN